MELLIVFLAVNLAGLIWSIELHTWAGKKLYWYLANKYSREECTYCGARGLIDKLIVNEVTNCIGAATIAQYRKCNGCGLVDRRTITGEPSKSKARRKLKKAEWKSVDPSRFPAKWMHKIKTLTLDPR